MKRLIKILFVSSILLFNAQLWASPIFDPVAVTLCGIGSLALVGGLAISHQYHDFSLLNDITQVSVFRNYIVEKILRNTHFLTFSRDASDKVLAGSIVYIRQAGASPQIIKNNGVWPMTVSRREDFDVNYLLDVYSSAPTHVPWQELQAIEYDKIDSVIGGHMNEVVQAYAEDMLIKWAPTTANKQVLTSGAAVGPVDAQAGNRKGFSPKDLQRQ
ncbi:hypothetical protein LWM68_40925 [Niabella sp. W65]|nr:hypothetical protein [Niabella sp. W65]MCH7368537.1 hypothetical protein [Niabella sp. W65]